MSEHTFIVRVAQRDDLEPVSAAEVERTVAALLVQGAWLDLVEIVPVKEVRDVAH
jgi:hypothetical protein